MSFTIGSLFDGSGGFPLAATMCGGVPKWASEVEPYPIAVTKSRFPNVKHLGSVTDIKGGEIEPVDVITFGSPCQDLSVAGKRAGLKHEANGDDETTRSGLFMEAVRIIKEMREATNGVYPRFALWENVPGAFSSNKGEDFRIVLQELIQVAEPTAVMPEVPKNGWPYADSYCGDGWSIAYRVLDAQFWGVPQRRRRIYLVADFRGECAGKVSFEREGLRGYFETGRTPWQTAAGDAEAGSGAADCERNCITLEPGIAAREGGHIYEGVSGTLRANAGDNQMAVAYSINHQGGNVELIIEDKVGTLTAAMNSSGNNKLSVAYSFDALSSNSMKSSNPHSGCRQVEVAKCLDTTDPNPCKNQGGIAVVEQVPYTLKIRSGCEGGGKGALVQENMSATLATNNDQYVFQPIPIHDQATRFSGKRGDNYDGKGNGLGIGNPGDPMNTLTAGDRHAVAYWDGGQTMATLTANNAGGNQRMPDKENFNCVIETHVVTKEDNLVVIDRAFFNQGQNAQYDPQYYTDGTCPTLVARGPAAVCYVDTSHADDVVRVDDVTAPLQERDHKGGKLVAYGVDCRNATEYPELNGTLQAKANGGFSYNCNQVVRVLYIVRRLTPTECARLQGFPDTWGHPIEKTELTDAEYLFWLNVRNTHAVINDKATKEYTKDQILKWYNGLHTDSSEYKMWGNGIALPNALYMMQGIADVMSEEKASRRKWLKDLLGDCL